MRPSVSVLLSWQPAQLATAGHDLVRRCADLQRQAGALTAVGSSLAGVWSGAAAQAATAHHTRRSAEVDELAAVVHTAGQALLAAADAVGQARASLQSALAAASAAGCTVLDDGTVLPPARPPVPGGLTDEALTAWHAEADATAAAQAAGAARLGAQVRAALTAAGAADDVSAVALSALRPPAVSPAPEPVRMGLTGGRWGPVALPSCPTTPEADEDEHGWLYDAVGGIGSGAWKTGPGMIGDVVGWIPLDAAQAVDDFTDRRYDDLSDWYDADTDSGVYRTADLSTQVGGFLGTGGVAAVRGVPALVRGGRSLLSRRAAEPVTFLSYRSGQTITNGHGGFVQAHHTIQDAAVRGLAGYDRAAAPALIMLRADHAATFAAQRGVRASATYRAERQIAARALREAGYTADEVTFAIKQADAYFLETLGWTMDTPVNVVRSAATAAGGGAR